MPDLDKCKALAEVFGVSLDDLANYEPEENMGIGLPPKGKYLFGMVTVGDKGQIVIPAKARKLFNISTGDQLFITSKRTGQDPYISDEKGNKIADLVRER